jgi:hypothetical protein
MNSLFLLCGLEKLAETIEHYLTGNMMENFYSLKNYKLVLSETVHEPGEPLVL